MLGTNPDFSAISLIRDRRSSGTSSIDGTSNMLLTLTRGQQADLAARAGEDGAGPLPALLAGRGPGRLRLVSAGPGGGFRLPVPVGVRARARVGLGGASARHRVAGGVAEVDGAEFVGALGVLGD